MTKSEEIRSESYSQTYAELGPRQREVITELLSGPRTAWEIADKTNRMVHSVRPRLNELAKLGIACEVGKRWHEATSRHETLWTLAQSKQINFL